MGKVLQTFWFANTACFYIQMIFIPVTMFSKSKGSVLLRTTAPGCLEFDVAFKSSNTKGKEGIYTVVDC